MELVTIGITSFERLECLQRLLLSIKATGKARPVIVADNSREPQQMGALRLCEEHGAELIGLPFDAGLAACRNAIMQAATTEYVLLLEEDFIFCNQTRIDWLVRAMLALTRYGVNVVSGAVCNGKPGDVGASNKNGGWLHGMYRHNRTLLLATGPTGQLGDYPTCDLTINFCLIWRKAALQHPWREELKQGEHLSWFWEGKQSGALRVAHCPTVQIIHKHVGGEFYDEHRKRLLEYRQQWLLSCGFDNVRTVKG